MHIQFKNKTVLVTGGTSGIGKATAKELVRSGATVIITGRNQETLNATLTELGSSAHAIKLDQGNMSEITLLGGQLSKLTTHLDGVFLNAGSGDFATIETITEYGYDSQFDVLVKGTFFTVQQLLPFIKKDSSMVFNVSSITEAGVTGALVYAATKGAVKSMVKTLARELAPKGIRVNGVFPGPIETDFFNKTSMTKDQIAGFGSQVLSSVPMGRFGTSQEVANVVVFLLSSMASYIHGSELYVDGGMSQI